MSRLWIAMLLLACSGIALAEPPAKARRQYESSMLVDGDIEVDAQGRVVRHELAGRDQLPDGVERFLDAQIAIWRFHPATIDGQPAASRNRMGLLLVAAPAGNGGFEVELRRASFNPLSRKDGYEVESVDMPPPLYPVPAARARVSGTVYLLVRIDAQGKVLDAAAEQVNLRVAGSAAEMTRWRELLARSAEDKALQWTFRPPHKGEAAQRSDWSVRVPVNYSLDQDGKAYGRWMTYIPGPRQRPSWLDDDDGVSPDALADGGVYPVGQDQGLRLVTPLSQG